MNNFFESIEIYALCQPQTPVCRHIMSRKNIFEKNEDFRSTYEVLSQDIHCGLIKIHKKNVISCKSK